MANEVIKRIAEVVESGTPSPSHFLLYDDGSKMLKTEASNAADAIRPVASEGEALAGTNNEKTATPLRVAQYLQSQIGVSVASKAQGDLANAALQPDDIGDTIELGASQGSVAYRDSAGWTFLPPGVSGQYLKTKGDSADPAWDTPAGAGDVLKQFAVGAFSSISAIAALDTTVYGVVSLTQPLRQGVWYKALYEDYAADVAADSNNGYVVRSTDDPAYVWLRDVQEGRYLVDWFRTAGDAKADDTASVKSAIQSVPSGAELHFTALTQYNLNEISATTRGHISIKGNGALINNTTQAAIEPDARPILRIFAQTQDFDVSISDLFIQGPRLTTDTTVGTGSYGGDPLNPGVGYSSGIDIPIGRRVTIRNCIISGTYFAGIEVHYAKNLLVRRCTLSNHGYAGVLFSDSQDVEMSICVIDDIGSVAPTNGYGVTSSTSYNIPGYAYDNIVVRVNGNKITRCKRKGLDIHNALNAIFSDNYVKGCGFAYFEAICEGADKKVARITLTDNIFEGDPTFLSGVVTNAIISMGQSGPSVAASEDTMMVASGNIIKGISAPNGIVFNNNQASGTNAVVSKAINNSFAGCTFAGAAITTANNAQLYKMVSVQGNDIQATVGSVHIYIKNAVDALSMGNICRNLGTPPSGITTVFDGVTNGNAINNMLDGTLGA